MILADSGQFRSSHGLSLLTALLSGTGLKTTGSEVRHAWLGSLAPIIKADIHAPHGQ